MLGSLPHGVVHYPNISPPVPARRIGVERVVGCRGTRRFHEAVAYNVSLADVTLCYPTGALSGPRHVCIINLTPTIWRFNYPVAKSFVPYEGIADGRFVGLHCNPRHPLDTNSYQRFTLNYRRSFSTSSEVSTPDHTRLIIASTCNATDDRRVIGSKRSHPHSCLNFFSLFTHRRPFPAVSVGDGRLKLSDLWLLISILQISGSSRKLPVHIG